MTQLSYKLLLPHDIIEIGDEYEDPYYKEWGTIDNDRYFGKSVSYFHKSWTICRVRRSIQEDGLVI